jgi:POT family proton-dependent oligopeptide transporter
MFYVCFDQMQNNLISQAGQMETNGTPNDLLPAMNQVGCVVFGPLIQEILYPLLHRRRIYPTPITRITIGFTFVTFSMMYATVVQVLIYKSPPCYNQPGRCGFNRIDVWIQAPLYFLISAGEIFAYVTALEYANENSPKALRVLVQAVGLLVGGIGSACAMALTPVARNPNLIAFYGSLTAGMAVTTILFWLLFRDSGRQPSTDNHTSHHNAAPGSLRQAPVCHLVDRVPEAAPFLKPIDAGGPIILPRRSFFCSSPPMFLSQHQDASETPTLPRRSVSRL